MLFSTSLLHNTYTLRSCASYSPEHRQESFCLYHTSCRRVSYVFVRDIDLSFLPNLTLATGQWTSLPSLTPAPVPGPFVFAHATLAAFGPQVEREQIRYPLTSTGEFEVLIAANPTVVCSRARLTRVISALQGSCRVVHRSVSCSRNEIAKKRGIDILV